MSVSRSAGVAVAASSLAAIFALSRLEPAGVAYAANDSIGLIKGDPVEVGFSPQRLARLALYGGASDSHDKFTNGVYQALVAPSNCPQTR
ncbi:MAG TPA: hypothetical protein VEV17_24870 [Bryobacteraceae bacterium]|nr:hypothetical protein [Bryobacteraceae bacterium]